MSEPTQTPPSLRDPPADISHDAPAPETPAEKIEQPKDAQSTPSIDLKALTDCALRFLATASNETLGACLVGLGAGTYLILGRVGLLLIGVVGGVMLHATWEGHTHGGEGQNQGQSPGGRRRELGADIAHRVLDWRETKGRGKGSEDDESNLDVKLYSGKELDFSDFRPETAAALTELTDAVIRDYVKYVKAEPPSFSSNVTQVVVLANLTNRNFISQFVPTDVDCLLTLRIRPPLSEATRRQLRRLRNALVLVHDHNIPRAFKCDNGLPRRCCLASRRHISQDETG